MSIFWEVSVGWLVGSRLLTLIHITQGKFLINNSWILKSSRYASINCCWSLYKVVYSRLMIKLAFRMIQCKSYIRSGFVSLSMIHVTCGTVDNAWLRNSVIWIVVCFFILSWFDLGSIDSLSTSCKTRYISSKFTIGLIWLIILDIVIRNLLLCLIGIHIILHIFPCSCQKACGFVHAWILTHLTSFCILRGNLLLVPLNLGRFIKAVWYSSLWVVMTIPLNSVLDIFFVVVLAIIGLRVINQFRMVLHNLWL